MKQRKNCSWVQLQFLTGRRPMRSFSPGGVATIALWKSAPMLRSSQRLFSRHPVYPLNPNSRPYGCRSASILTRRWGEAVQRRRRAFDPALYVGTTASYNDVRWTSSSHSPLQSTIERKTRTGTWGYVPENVNWAGYSANCLPLQTAIIIYYLSEMSPFSQSTSVSHKTSPKLGIILRLLRVLDYVSLKVDKKCNVSTSNNVTNRRVRATQLLSQN